MKCSLCASTLSLQRLHCDGCGVSFEGDFSLPRLARLAPESVRLAERFLLAGGNLKALAQDMDISYPTLRKRLDELIDELNQLAEADRQRGEALLEAVERGDIAPERAARQLRELNGGTP